MDDSIKYGLEHAKWTEDLEERHNITWNIPYFMKLLCTNTLTRKDNSPNYVVLKVPDTCFQVKMSFLGLKNELIKISFMSFSPIAVLLQLKLHINSSLRYNEDQHHTMDYRTIVANKWYDCVNLKDYHNASYYGQGNLTIDYSIILLDITKIAGLSLQFEKLMNDASNYDVTIKSVDGEEFKAHKLILATRCEVLKVHFEHNTIESITNVVETKWESEVLRDLLTFLYTDQAPRVDEHADKLLVAADFYRLNELKKMCEATLSKGLNIENAIDTLQLAELYSANVLKQSTLIYIQAGRAKQLTTTKGWKTLESVALIKIIYEFIMANDNGDILESALLEFSEKK